MSSTEFEEINCLTDFQIPNKYIIMTVSTFGLEMIISFYNQYNAFVILFKNERHPVFLPNLFYGT